MPHLQLEMSQDVESKIDVLALMSDLVSVFCGHETIDSKSVKCYLRSAGVWTMGEGAPPGFIHLTICVLAGRDPSLLRRISDSLYSVLTAHVHKACEAAVTLEIRQMDSVVYRK